MKKEENLELRMYGLVPYNISDIQKGIQFGHSVVRYGRNVTKLNSFNKYHKQYIDWADNHETFVILNGGTTNIRKGIDGNCLGSLNNYHKMLTDRGILTSDFYEPDLGDQLTAFCLIIDERVFNRKKYPEYDTDILGGQSYEEWVDTIGGEENVFIRNLLYPLRLA
jgi:hypothetical protein